MAAPQNFRSALGGFKREDVVQYLEYLNNKHQSQVAQLSGRIEELNGKLREQEAQEALVASLQAESAALREECAALRAQLKEAEEKLASQPEPQPEPQQLPEAPTPQAKELETYRRAQRVEKDARQQAQLLYYQVNGVLTEATAKVNSAADHITEMADQVMGQLTQLQMAVSGSKQAIQEAADLMSAIRPNK